ncbi:hypothetical protein EMIT0194P_90009 [Pseudomonas serbica]
MGDIRLGTHGDFDCLAHSADTENAICKGALIENKIGPRIARPEHLSATLAQRPSAGMLFTCRGD